MITAQIEEMSLRTFYSFITGVGAFGVLAFFSWLIIFKGQLVTKREYDAQKKLADEWKQEAEKWETLAFRSLSVRENSERRDAVIAVAVEKVVTKPSEQS